MKIREDLKKRVRDSGHKLADLSRAMDMNYDLLNSYLNGRKPMSEAIEDRIEDVLIDWRNDAK